LVLALVLVGMILMGALWLMSTGSPRSLGNEAASRASAPSAMFASEFIQKYGRPDSDDNTADDDPRPLMVSRIMVYQAADVRVICVPDAPRGDTPPPYNDWKIMGFVDTKTETAISREAAIARIDAARSTPVPTLDVALRVEALGLRVTNLTDIGWRGCTVMISGGYIGRIGVLRPKAGLDVPFDRMATNGEARLTVAEGPKRTRQDASVVCRDSLDRPVTARIVP
jgi:hypothetical protein